ncbi:MAG: chemotaxis protein [Epsilonproteobacteria bacterium]|nr:chemotaxis protein [Campylobacterota bacterium]
MINQELINELQTSKEEIDRIIEKLIKNLRREEKILRLSDKRQRKEYDELQQKYQEIKKLQETQQKLLDSFIKVIANAIDAKSEYMGAHCERVPVITSWLLKAVNDCDEIDYKIKTQDEEKEILTAAWLHDTGKITTPDFIMDKAVKLETVYNRIHEIRMRFEVIYRDLEIEALKRKMNGEDEKEVDEWLEKERKKLIEEFEFVARLNIGTESVDDDDIERLKQIAKRKWIRHFDNTIGLSRNERKRILETEGKKELPVEEPLLADKPYHIVKRSPKEFEMAKKYGFKIKIPENLYNFGEIYNLSIRRGTITPEEYFKIQEHVIMTIIMLEDLPFPEQYKNIPFYAGAHHEMLNGRGYPRKLKGDEVPIPARIIAIADIFEALTATDRPYKNIKKLSEAIDILVYKALQGELDKDILIVFLKSRIFEKYAKMYMLEEQIDDVDIDFYIDKLKGK